MNPAHGTQPSWRCSKVFKTTISISPSSLTSWRQPIRPMQHHSGSGLTKRALCSIYGVRRYQRGDPRQSPGLRRRWDTNLRCKSAKPLQGSRRALSVKWPLRRTPRGSNHSCSRSANHLSSVSVKATVGWRGGRDPVVAGPRQSRSDNARFLEARALFHAAFACQSGPRLITESRSWDQQASRAFAAELLAPRDELSGGHDDSEGLQDTEQFVADLAAEYGVSSKVIRHQFENVGISLDAA